MNFVLLAKRCSAPLALGASLFAMPAWGQGAPLRGTIGLTLAPSTARPALSSSFTVDLAINMASATGTCAATTATTPMTLGGYVLGIGYDSTKLQFVSAARCPTTHPQITDPNCRAKTDTPTSAFVACTGMSTAVPDHPQGGPLCVARLTFTNLSAGTASLRTIHSPAPFGISTDYFRTPNVCGGPVVFSSSAVTDGAASLNGN